MAPIVWRRGVFTMPQSDNAARPCERGQQRIIQKQISYRSRRRPRPRNKSARHRGRGTRTRTKQVASNNAIILKLFEERSDNGLHYYDRWNSEQHPPQAHEQRACDNRNDNNKWMNIHRAANNKGLEKKIIEHVCNYDQNQI